MTSPQPDSLDAILQSLSKDIWERLRDVSALPTAHSVRFGEETITDILMLDLNRHGLTRTVFIQTPKSKEALTGTDFEWWLGSDAAGWIRLAVQAKKIHLESERYPNLKHSVKGMSQVGLLERFAARHGAIPLYCLYNYTDKAESFKHWHCCQRPFQEEELGCTPKWILYLGGAWHCVQVFKRYFINDRWICPNILFLCLALTPVSIANCPTDYGLE